MSLQHRLSLLFCVFALTSCGFRSQHQSDVAMRTISIPYAVGDTNGQFTEELICDIEREGAFRYVPDGGELTLRVVFVDSKYENIGFRYDKLEAKEEGVKHKKRLIPNE